MTRIRRDFTYRNADGQDGFIRVSYGPWGQPGDAMSQRDAPIMVQFDDAVWMGIEDAEGLVRWLRSALAEAKRKHVPRYPDDAA